MLFILKYNAIQYAFCIWQRSWKMNFYMTKQILDKMYLADTLLPGIFLQKA